MRRISAFLLALIVLCWSLPSAAQSYTASPGTTSSTWTVGGPRGIAYPASGTTGLFLTVSSSTVAAWTAITIPTLTGVATSSGCLSWTGAAYAWVTCGGGGGTSVTGTGLWWSNAGTLLGAAQGLSGDASVGTPSAGNIPFTLATVNGSVGSFGSSSVIPIPTVNAKGLITAVSTATVAAPLGSATGTLSAANGGTGVASPTAHSVLVAEGASPFTPVALGAGQILVGQSGADPAAETVSSDATLSSTGALTLANTAVTPGTYGSPSSVSNLTFDAKGRATAASSVAISIGNSNLLSGSYPNITGTGTTLAGDVAGAESATVLNKITAASALDINQPAFTWRQGAGAPTFSQATAAVGVTPTSMNWTPQAANAGSATTASGTPGSVVVSLSAPVSTGKESYFQINRASGMSAYLGDYPGSGAYMGLWLLPSGAPSGSNYVVLADGSNSFLNALSSGGSDLFQLAGTTYYSMTTAGFQVGGSPSFDGGNHVLSLVDAATNPTSVASGHTVIYSSAHQLETNGTAIQFSNLVTTPTFGQAAATTTTSGRTVKYTGQNGGPTGTTNGGGAALIGGTPSGGGASGIAYMETGGGETWVYASPSGLQLIGGTPSFGGGTGVIGITNASVFPSSAPTGGGILAETYGQLYHVGSGGVTEAESHSASGYTTQQKQFDAFSAGGTSTMGGTFVTATSSVSLASGHSVLLRCHGVSTVTTAGTNISVGDSAEMSADLLIKNVAGTVSQVGIATTVSKVLDTNYNATSTVVAWNNSGTTIGCIMVPVVGTAGGSPVATVTVWGEAFFN